MKKNIIVKVGKITLGAVVALIVVGTIGMAKLVSDSVLYQNKGNDTQGNSVKQLATYGYDLDGFNAEYSGKEIAVTTMGAQVSAIYASNVTPGTEEAADAVICDSPVPGMEYMVRSVIADDDPKEMESFVTSFLTDTSKLYSRLFYGVNWDEGDTIIVVANDQLPTLVFVSEKDTVCLPEKVEEVYENVGSQVKSIAYVNSKHIEGVIDDPAGYMEYVDTFLANAGL
ncbi:hypothetical protein [Butyrivibrio sp. WCD3002]|uniref:hypothetical protein n=1 Tax=Butyrivibrio sp. WCD3002 TaxID=1280676 RepID=UPI00040392B3|nr:hypothetical protein [Butyrivibrio sp. WCD3002]